MAEAMVKGLKRVESRPRPLFAPGWYFLHKGKKTGFDEDYAQELQSLLPEHSSGLRSEAAAGRRWLQYRGHCWHGAYWKAVEILRPS